MPPILQQLVDWLVPALCGGALTLCGAWATVGRALVQGVRELLLCKIGRASCRERV